MVCLLDGEGGERGDGFGWGVIFYFFCSAEKKRRPAKSILIEYTGGSVVFLAVVATIVVSAEVGVGWEAGGRRGGGEETEMCVYCPIKNSINIHDCRLL